MGYTNQRIPPPASSRFMSRLIFLSENTGLFGSIVLLGQRMFPQRLYNSTGARQFLVVGLTPFGCTAFALGLGLPALNPAAYGPLDQAGCAQGINEFVKEYNKLLLVEIRSLRTRLSDATIIYADTFSIIYDVVSNPSKYG